MQKSLLYIPDLPIYIERRDNTFLGKKAKIEKEKKIIKSSSLN